jgi:hypothetical protein
MWYTVYDFQNINSYVIALHIVQYVVKETNENEKVISDPTRSELQKPSKSTQLTISSDFKLGPPATVIIFIYFAKFWV